MTGEQKAYVDSVIQQWTNGGLSMMQSKICLLKNSTGVETSYDNGWRDK